MPPRTRIFTDGARHLSVTRHSSLLFSIRLGNRPWFVIEGKARGREGSTRWLSALRYFLPGSGVIRNRLSSMTEKCPAQSSRLSRTATATSATCAAEGALMRNKMMPAEEERPRRKANSPKSLSKVIKIRCSEAARFTTSSSGLPGESVRAQNTSCPRARSASTAAPGKFSLARMHIRGWRPGRPSPHEGQRLHTPGKPGCRPESHLGSS